MSKRILITVALLGLFICSMLILVPVQPAQAQFVIASWDFPDEYSQGIWKITVLENSTGSWLYTNSKFYNQSHLYDWEASVGIGLYVYTWLNSTLVNVVDHDIGKNYQHVDVNVSTFTETDVFSEQNITCVFTQEGGFGFPAHMWLYTNSVILNFLPEQGQLYTVTITYEVFY